MSIDTSILSNIAIILVEPKFAENIGATARAMYNMGLSRLVVVRPELPDYKSMAKMATHNAVHIIDNIELYPSLKDAVSPFSQIIGTTARTGKQRLIERTPKEVITKIIPLLPKNEIAFLFGPEDRGLTNNDLKYCQFTSTIPTADFSSLNLAQSVGIHCYELYNELIHTPTQYTTAPRLASSFELEGMYEYIDNALSKMGFLENSTHQYLMRKTREILGRLQITSRESCHIRKICKQFIWYNKDR